VFQGTIDGASVHPREVVKGEPHAASARIRDVRAGPQQSYGWRSVAALKQNAASVILAHPHPSGVAEPSQADEIITRRLKEALGLVDIGVLDHIIVAGGDTTSFAELGLL
jgi:DNA repair protein RadC